MKLYSLNTGNFKLDGGAMFGVVPKSMWNKHNPADENNMCNWAMRSLLIEDGKRLILIDTGMGNKQSEKFFSHYFLHGDDSVDKGLAALGFHRNDITDVFLTHLHFDHVGGAIERDANGNYIPAFSNAHYWSNQRHWKWATEPNARERASFLKENILPIQESGQLKFIDAGPEDITAKTPLGFDVHLVNGHTDAQMLPIIKYHGQTIIFMADLVASAGHIPIPYVMGYDTRPLLTLQEKQRILPVAAEKEYILFLEHDYTNECCLVKMTEKGPRLASTDTLKGLIG
jgi:glyoxylase-like metal-dependent hydrolase (beta-lactamase superfamily II)